MQASSSFSRLAPLILAANALGMDDLVHEIRCLNQGCDLLRLRDDRPQAPYYDPHAPKHLLVHSPNPVNSAKPKSRFKKRK